MDTAPTTGPLSILYTHNLGGDLDLLPRLHTFLRLLRAQCQRFEDDDAVLQCAVQPPTRRVLLVDVGQNCAPGVWHCDVTGGRSTLVALDAMGYDAADASHLEPGARERLPDSLSLVAVDAAHAYRNHGVAVVAPGGHDLTPRPDLVFVLEPHDAAGLRGHRLYPQRLRKGDVGVAHVAPGGVPRLSGHEVFSLPSGTQPDATIAGAVDFVLAEARYYQRKQPR